MTKSGNNTLTLSGDNFDAENTDYSAYLGQTILGSGTFNLGSADAIGSLKTIKPQFTFEGGTLQFSASNTDDISSTFNTTDNQQYKIDTNGQSVNFASALTSSGGSLEKSGTGTLTLSGNNTFTGDTTISAGTLKLTGNLSSSTDLIVGSSGTLDLQTTQTFATLDLDGAISNSNTDNASAFTITGAASMQGTAPPLAHNLQWCGDLNR